MQAAYVLVAQYGARQSDVAKVLRCSQPTIASWVKEMGFRREIGNLRENIDEANQYIQELLEEMRCLEFSQDEDVYEEDEYEDEEKT